MLEVYVLGIGPHELKYNELPNQLADRQHSTDTASTSHSEPYSLLDLILGEAYW
jgi:hypothetical protein